MSHADPMVSVQAPAEPRMLGQLVSEAKVNLNFWLHSSGWYSALPKFLTGQNPSPSPQKQETQSERNAKVTSIKPFPETAIIKEGEREFFAALALDQAGIPVSGVKFTWQALDLDKNTAVKMSQTGEFVGASAGNYRLTAEGAGRTAQVTVSVVKDDKRPAPNTAPTSVKQVSSRDVPTTKTAVVVKQAQRWTSGRAESGYFCQ